MMKVTCCWAILSHLLLLAAAQQIPLGVGTADPKTIPIETSSGFLVGTTSNGVNSFKGIRYALPPTGEFRWTPPQPFFSEETFQANKFGPSCIQQFLGAQELTRRLFNTPPPASESEDCLFLNVWAPAEGERDEPKPVLVWLHGGGLAFGHGSHPTFDGSVFAKNQSVIVVTFNYRTNVFGFPGYSANVLPPKERNLGFMDQDLVLDWVRNNIAAFGGDPHQVTINGESAGAISIGHILQRHREFTPFRAAIMQSGAASSIQVMPPADRQAFYKFADAHNCTRWPWNPEKRLECLRNLPTQTIETWLNGANGVAFSPFYDGLTAFCDPFPRILQGETANVPILMGVNQDDGSVFAPMPPSNVTLEDWLKPFRLLGIEPNAVRQIYKDRPDDRRIISDVIRDAGLLCPSQMTAEISLLADPELPIFRYIYGAKFQPEPFPDAGAWHSSEMEFIFGTYNQANATTEMRQLSETLQSIWANFIKDPGERPHPDWPRYDATIGTQTLAKLAFNGTSPHNVIELIYSSIYDTPCHELWNSKIVDNTCVACGRCNEIGKI